ncbi:MAG: hypothetical protein A2Y17_03805 [Clostridiales bacterium GWF2_38_85]|nr:MAG: hypothetical protein A2Y17_03805 [Clostridiales bacterium GWF2_38_85]HBL83920.1 hypothetical protein [Clostridiales bacterium]
MKKIIIFLITLSMVIIMFGCETTQNENSKTDLSDNSKEQSDISSNTESNEQSIIDDSSINENSDMETSVDESLPEDAPIANFYIPNSEDYDSYDIISDKYDGTIEGLISKLIKLKGLPENIKTISFEIKDDNIAYIDLSKEFSESMTGSMRERQLVIALVNTIIDCYDVEAVSYTVEGNIIEDGQLEHDKPVPFINDSGNVYN